MGLLRLLGSRLLWIIFEWDILSPYSNTIVYGQNMPKIHAEWVHYADFIALAIKTKKISGEHSPLYFWFGVYTIILKSRENL